MHLHINQAFAHSENSLLVFFTQRNITLSENIRIFAATESATLPIRIANQGGSFAFMGTIRLYTKQALSISEQIKLLKSRGLNIADFSKASKFLGEISYFRFIQYLRPMEVDKVTHIFKPNSRFEDAVALYNFDLELRILMFKAIQRLEYAVSCCIAYWLDSMGYGDNFKNNLKSLFISYPQVDPTAMGFPNNWTSEPLWR